MKKFLHTAKYYLAAFIIPIIVILVAFAFRGIEPFGSHNLLVSDLATQYLPFFDFLRSQLVHHTFSTYSFMLSLGDNAIPIYTYYLMSPLNLLVVFVKAANVPLLMEAIIVMKIGLISLSMEFFLNVKYHRQDIQQVLAAIAYGLCGFVAMYFYDFMWLEALMLLPLVTLSLERLFTKGKWGCYVVTLAVAIILNYYMGYMMCIYSVIYFIYLVLLHRPAGTKFWHYLREHGEMTCKYVISSILAAMLSCFMLIPTIVGMLSTGKGSLSLVSFLPTLRFLPSAFVSLGVGATNFVGRLNHEPSFFIGSLFEIGLFVFWLSKRVSKKEKHASYWLVGAIFFGMLISTFDTIWHMFQMPAGFPFREVYMLSFVVIMLGYEAYLKGAFQNNQIVVKAGVIVAALVSLGYVSAVIEYFIAGKFGWSTPFYVASYWHLVWALLFILATILMLIAINRYGNKLWWLMLALVALEMGTNAWMSLGGTHEYGSQSKFAHAFEQSTKIIKTQQTGKHQFGRSNINNQLYGKSFNINYNQYNDSLLYNFFGVNSYTSSLNVHTHDSLSKLGLYSRNERRISVNGSMPVTNQLLNIDNHVQINRHGKYHTHRDYRFSGLGYAVSDKINGLHLDSNNVFKNLNSLVQKEAGNQTNYFVANQINHVQVKEHRHGYQYKVKTTPQMNGIQYFDSPTTSPNQFLQIKVDGKPLKTAYHQLGAEIIRVGRYQKGQSYTITFNSNQKIKHLNRDLAGFDENKFNQFVKDTQPYRLQVKNPQNLKFKGNHFVGFVRTTKQRPQLLISIPYDKGWQVTDNGKPVKLKKVINGLTGIKLKPGKHKLEFTYHIPGLVAGIILTVLGIVGIGGELIYFRRKDKNRGK
ncbi:hypothetical protein BGL34_03720 [Fructilactobacillus lindneri]|uniref:Integral membrane protein n=2 Tax=Fructilactobacillus lindneri TaxID=53444 RepID=A0A0R2JSG4_9LACO|nr:YfhO family protein [Fructilactobacillus lindneri]ANZ57769.1 hypothetical protein AYR60_02810 [Fructilactobacillus lindneri]ANZ59038.1 hypothetical protein AYR59_02810 [Fructilactobacillus lindneri]KRN78790.1 hypothetical protein IV52_GL001069 [Fructilactobacillus lindneri DSM 20690 = JCM 11027]POG98092.1 hypothetical protein BGL31_03140 [Fructilactobacillus lindneri]POH01793.1 hypothetical protein BGL32_04290 [Fructilactobacillus lindneri]